MVASSSGPSDGQESLLRQYTRVLRKRLWLVLVVWGIIVLTVLLDTVKTRPVYQATARLMIEKEHSDIISFDEAVGKSQVIDPMVTYSSYYQTQYEILQSRSLALRVINALQLQQHADFTTKVSPGLIHTLMHLPHTLLKALLNLIPTRSQSADEQAAGVSATSATAVARAPIVGSFLSRLRVKPVPNSRLVDVSFTAYDPRLAAEVANALARIYVDQNLEGRFTASQQSVDWLYERTREMREKVKASELDVQRYKEDHGIVSLEEGHNAVVRQLAELNIALTAAKTELIDVETRYQEMRKYAQRPEMIEAIPSVLNNELIHSLKESYADLQRTAAELETRWGPQHPGMIQHQSRLEVMRRKLRAEILKVVQGIKTDYEVAKARVAALQQAFEQQKQEAQKLSKKAIHFDVLKRETESNQQLYNVLLSNMKKSGISTGLKRNNIRVIDPAEVPGGPIKPRPVTNLMRAALVGLILAIGLALFLESLDNTLKTAEEAEKLLQTPIIGAVGRFTASGSAAQRNDTALVIVQQPFSHAAEAFKTVRANLLMSYAEPAPKVFLLTSPHPKDGKTTVAANLAIAMAQLERRVLLVDADLRNPSLHLLFGQDNTIGLSQLLFQEQYEDIAVHKVVEDTLSLLPAGTCPPNPSEMLGSARMRRFIEVSRECYDAIILDTPPVLAVSDALVASTLADGIVLVLRAGSTPRPHARRTLTQLRDFHGRHAGHGMRDGAGMAPGRILGVVMNFLDPREGDSYYGEHSYYYRPTETLDVAPPTLIPSDSERG